MHWQRTCYCARQPFNAGKDSIAQGGWLQTPQHVRCQRSRPVIGAPAVTVDWNAWNSAIGHAGKHYVVCSRR